MDKITKLSDAIRLGATFRPQCAMYLFSDGKSCALGAAYEAVTGEYLPQADDLSATLMQRFHVPYELLCDIAFRNDVANNSREEIADWLESHGY